MRTSGRIAAAAVVLLLLACVADPRVTRHWSMADLTKEAGLIVIAKPSEVKKTGERMGKDGWQAAVAGVVTTFRVEAVLKGESDDKPLAVHHFVWEDFNGPILNGPQLVQFEVKQDGPSHLLFLKKRPDGGYEPLAGQMDPVHSCFVLSRGTEAPIKARAD
jgi:hypothetical protein